VLPVACCRLLTIVSQELTGTAAQEERLHVLGVPACFDDHAAEAAAVVGSLIAEADATSSGAATETAANAAVHRYPPKLVGIASPDFYQQRPPLWH
jgi:urea transporter